MSDEPTDESPASEDDSRSLAMTLSLGMVFGAAIGSIVFAVTGEVLWIALAPGFGLAMGLLYHSIRAEGQLGD